MRIENVTEKDAAEILEIYGPYITGTAISFEYVIPTLEEFTERVRDIASKYPYLKAVDDSGRILGYAYANSFKTRAAYDWSVETTIYLRPEVKRGGIGKALYNQLEKELREMGILNMNACIAVPKENDPYLTDGSIRFHEKMGFSLIGTFHDSGYKLGRWYDMIWMEKMLGEHKQDQEKVKFRNI